MDWFTVDKAGLAQLIERRGAATAVLELIQNAWDTDAASVHVGLRSTTPKRAQIQVFDDDPKGFENLAHAFTLFAPSTKKGDATRRGRFNLGEKLVLALCDEAEISTTTGTVYFDSSGRTMRPKLRRQFGSRFTATIRLSKRDVAEVERLVSTLLVPESVQLDYNGRIIEHRPAKRTFEIILPTEVADEEGTLRRTRRKTTVRLVDPGADEIPHLYELGIPVVEIDVPWHIDIAQKVPLNFERNNVTPAYLRTVHQAVLDNAWDELSEDEAAAPWVGDALESDDVSDDAVKAVVQARFGSRAVIYDPRDPEANAKAVNQGYTVIHGGTFNKQQWGNIRRSQVVQPAGRVTPSAGIKTSADGVPPIPREQWTPAQRSVIAYAEQFAQELIGKPVKVSIFNLFGENARAWYGGSDLSLNLARLGRKWFENPDQHEVDALLLHELAHDRVSNHLSADYHDELCRLGAKARDVQVRLLGGKAP